MSLNYHGSMGVRGASDLPGEQSTALRGWRAAGGEGKSSPSSGHLRNLEPEVFGIYCSPEEVLWSIKKRFLAAGDHYGKHSVGHAAAATLPEDGNVFGSEFGASVPLMLSPSLLLPLIFQVAARRTYKRKGGRPWLGTGCLESPDGNISLN